MHNYVLSLKSGFYPIYVPDSPDSTIAAIYGGAVGGILVLVCLIGIVLIALLLLRKKLSSEEQIAAPIYEEVGLSGNDIQLESNDAYGKVYMCTHYDVNMHVFTTPHACRLLDAPRVFNYNLTRLMN